MTTLSTTTDTYTPYPTGTVVRLDDMGGFAGAAVTILDYNAPMKSYEVALYDDPSQTRWIVRSRIAATLKGQRTPVPAPAAETSPATTTETLKGLNPMVRAERIEAYMREHDASAAAAAAHFGIQVQSVYTFRQPLNFPDAVKAQLRSGALSFEQAIALVRRIRRGETVTLAPARAEADRPPVAAPALPEPVVVAPVVVAQVEARADDLDTLDWEPYQNTRGGLPHSTQPLVSVRKDGSVFLNKELMLALGQPTYLCLSYHRERRLLRLTPSEGGVGTVRISTDKRRQGAATISIKGFFLRFAITLPSVSVKLDASVCGGSAIVALEWS